MREIIKTLTDENLELVIREKLKYKWDEPRNQIHDPIRNDTSKDHKRFDMSGYGENNSCHIHNTNILNLFSDFGIYDKVRYLYLDTYKGIVMVYYMWFNENTPLELDLTNLGTVEIIKKIIKYFYLDSDKKDRRM